jgi:genome maintenance exonuclease 1
MSNNYTSPPFVGKFTYKNCVQINDPVTKKRVYQTPDGESLPSVTTILGATKDMTALNEWKRRVGEERAAQISKEASGIGTSMHANLERFLTGLERQPGNNVVHVQANKMADVIIENGLKNVSEVWAMEQSLYFPELYSGTTDLVGVYSDEPAVMDYKQSNKLKKEEWIEDYKLQLMAYIMAHNEVYKTDIRRGIIFICTRDLEFQQFEVNPGNFNLWQDKWLERVEKFYQLR